MARARERVRQADRQTDRQTELELNKILRRRRFLAVSERRSFWSKSTRSKAVHTLRVRRAYELFRCMCLIHFRSHADGKFRFGFLSARIFSDSSGSLSISLSTGRSSRLRSTQYGTFCVRRSGFTCFERSPTQVRFALSFSRNKPAHQA